MRARCQSSMPSTRKPARDSRQHMAPLLSVACTSSNSGARRLVTLPSPAPMSSSTRADAQAYAVADVDVDVEAKLEAEAETGHSGLEDWAERSSATGDAVSSVCEGAESAALLAGAGELECAPESAAARLENSESRPKIPVDVSTSTLAASAVGRDGGAVKVGRDWLVVEVEAGEWATGSVREALRRGLRPSRRE